MTAVIASLIRVMSLLVRATFNKIIGVEPILIKGFLNVLPTFMKKFRPNHTQIHLHIVKSIGIFLS